jgi:hypothetical protein
VSTAERVTIYIDHVAHLVAAGRHTGAQIRALLSPPARDLFWDIADAPDQVVAPDAVITVADGMRFFTMAPVIIYLNAHPYPVRPGAIAEQQLRDLVTPPIGADQAIWLDIPDAKDRRLAHGELVEVDGGERFFSAPEHHHEVTIIVNTRPRRVAQHELTFQQLVELAFENPPTGENVLFTITYSKAAGPPTRRASCP